MSKLSRPATRRRPATNPRPPVASRPRVASLIAPFALDAAVARVQDTIIRENDGARVKQSYRATPHLSVDLVVMVSQAVAAFEAIRSRNLSLFVECRMGEILAGITAAGGGC